MRCIQYASFVVLINGSPSKLFSSSRCLRHGFPVSHFLFLLVAEGLNKLIGNARIRGEIEGVKTIPSKIVSYLLFVDDILMFGV